MFWDHWTKRWQAVLDRCDALGGTVSPLIVHPPSTTAPIHEIERELRCELPVGFLCVLVSVSSSISFRWFLPTTFSLPPNLNGIFSGGLTCDLATLRSAELERRELVKDVFSDPEDLYDSVWHNKLGFASVPNGDMIAFDLSTGSDCSVVYLSHDDSEAHGYKLADNFMEFVDRWSLLGCPGPEDWQMLPFIESASSGLLPRCANAKLWRQCIGLQLPDEVVS